MAIMIPREPPHWEPGAYSERLAFEALSEELNDDMFVYHRFSFVQEENAKEGEIDFLILHREKGMLAVECKGEGVRRGGDGEWERKFRDGYRRPLKKSPFAQAQDSLHTLKRNLEPKLRETFPRISSFPFVCGHAVVFPRALLHETNLPQDIPHEIVYDAKDLENIGAKIEETFGFWSKKFSSRPTPLTKSEFKRFRRRILHPNLEIVPCIGANIHAGNRAFVKLTKEQCQVVRGLMENPRVKIGGGAGTGKTVLAVEAARIYAEKGMKVLLVCFNRALGDYLKGAASNLLSEALADTDTSCRNDANRGKEPGAKEAANKNENENENGTENGTKNGAENGTKNGAENGTKNGAENGTKNRAENKKQGAGHIHATTFHRLCARAHRTLHNEPLQVPEEKTERARFWLEDAPLVLLEALDSGILKKYDAVIVDEGQDFAPAWWTALEDCLANPKTGRITVFYDRSQLIFDRPDALPSDYPTFKLTRNFRNTRRIAHVVQKLGAVEMEPAERCPQGEPPEVHREPSAPKLKRIVGDLVNHLVNKEKISPEQVVILTPHSRKNSFLADEECLGGFPLAASMIERADHPGSVLHTTIAAFKGLESDVVILVHIDPKDPRCSRNARYVAVSRARHLLHVYGKGDPLDQQNEEAEQ